MQHATSGRLKQCYLSKTVKLFLHNFTTILNFIRAKNKCEFQYCTRKWKKKLDKYIDKESSKKVKGLIKVFRNPSVFPATSSVAAYFHNFYNFDKISSYKKVVWVSQLHVKMKKQCSKKPQTNFLKSKNLLKRKKR